MTACLCRSIHSIAALYLSSAFCIDTIPESGGGTKDSDFIFCSCFSCGIRYSSGHNQPFCGCGYLPRLSRPSSCGVCNLFSIIMPLINKRLYLGVINESNPLGKWKSFFYSRRVLRVYCEVSFSLVSAPLKRKIERIQNVGSVHGYSMMPFGIQ